MGQRTVVANSLFGLCVAFSLGLFAPQVAGQEPDDKASEAQPPAKISDEPRTIPPDEVLPAALTKNATHDFSDSSLRELVAWLQDEQKLVVLVDKKSLADLGITTAEPVSDRLQDAPIYLLLNRLRSLGLGWYYQDDILYITSLEAASARLTTLPYNVGDLLDEDFDLDRIIDVISSTIEPDSWEDVGGPSALNSLGDVLFVRQNDRVHQEIKVLLKALSSPGRQTFLNDPKQHLKIRATLQKNVNVDFQATPLESAVQELAERVKTDARLDVAALQAARIRERVPITLKLEGRSLETVLQAMALELELTWLIRDGVIWITSSEVADAYRRTAVYDVRDLCQDGGETKALIDAITSQAAPDSWSDVGGDGEIEFAVPGVIVITQGERLHQQVLSLIETYRSALRTSKPRSRPGSDPNEVVTVYYRLHKQMAEDLADYLPLIVQRGKWQVQDANAPGKIMMLASEPDLGSLAAAGKVNTGPVDGEVVARSVLIIEHTRAAHRGDIQSYRPSKDRRPPNELWRWNGRRRLRRWVLDRASARA